MTAQSRSIVEVAVFPCRHAGGLIHWSCSGKTASEWMESCAAVRLDGSFTWRPQVGRPRGPVVEGGHSEAHKLHG